VTEAGIAIADLLAATDGPKVLVTSRIPLRLRWEWRFPLEPLPAPAPEDETGEAWWDGWAALHLFEIRARAADPAFALGPATAPDVAAICRRVDGLPLAIELAASRSDALPPAAILARLERRLPTLSRGARDLPERQQTMHNAIAWGFDLLPPEERVFACRLALFAGSFPLSGAFAVHPAADDALAIDHLGALASKQIIRRTFDGDAADPRFMMLDTIREFALAELRDAGDEPAARRDLAGWLLAIAAERPPDGRAADPFDPADPAWAAQVAWLDRLERERATLHEAMQHAAGDSGEEGVALALAAAWWPCWLHHGHAQEGEALIALALAAPGGEDVHRAEALHGRGLLLAACGEIAGAAADQQAALDLARTAGLDDLAARADAALAALNG
jgi:predicted ATPase